MSTIIESLRAKLAAIGGTLDDTDYTLNLDAPSGYVWCANRESNYPIHYATNRESWLAKAVREEEASLRMGLERVTDNEELKEIRYSLDDDNWGAALTPDSPKHIDWS